MTNCRRSSSATKTLQHAFGILIDEASKMLIPKKYMEGHTETMMGMFDALIAWQVGSDFARAAAIGSTAGRAARDRLYDTAGAKAAEELSVLSGAVMRVQVPSGKDLNEFYQQAGENTVKEWLQNVTAGRRR